MLAYWAADMSIQIAVYDPDPSGNGPLKLQTSINDEVLDPFGGERELEESGRFDIMVGDFDGDRTDEILLVAVEAAEVVEDNWQIFARVYDLDDSGNLIPKGRSLAPNVPLGSRFRPGNAAVNRMASASGDFNGDLREELAFAYEIAPTNESAFETCLLFAIVSEDLMEVTAVTDPSRIEGSSGSKGIDLALASGDMDGDGNDELAYSHRQGLRIFSIEEEREIVDDELVISFNRSSLGIWSLAISESFIHRSLAITDLDAGTSGVFGAEVIAVDQLEIFEDEQSVGYEIRLRAFTLGENQAVAEIREQFIGDTRERMIAVATGDFNGDSILLGPPRKFSRTDIVQPLIILNAPPLHFDSFDGVNFDINKCFDPNPLVPCEHRATYVNSQTVEVDVETQISADWGMSKELTGEISSGVGAFFGVRIGMSLTNTYGEGFSKVEGSSNTFTVTSTTSAINDDLIYASVIDYDIFEYPAYAEGDFLGYVVSVVPSPQQPTWFGSKDERARTYLNNHEVGNILSYPPESGAVSNELVERAIRFIEGDRWTLSASSTQSWELRFSDIETSERQNSAFQQVSRRTEVEFNVGGEIPLIGGLVGSFQVGFGANIEGNYGSSQISTHRTTLQNERSLLVDFGPIDGAILGTRTYDVIPFAYWAANGAMVLDYAVNPSEGGGVPSWWEAQYGDKPDLAFTLPFRNDEAKGLGSVEPEVQREETRDIVINPVSPISGEIVTIFSRVRNLSLFPANSPSSTLEFYVGDPRNGGTLIINEDGKSQVGVPPIQPRGEVILALQNWRVPTSGLDQRSKIYAMLDSAEQVDEIHEDNNIGWNLIGAVPGGLWSESTDLGDNWRFFDWFGFFNLTFDPWILHLEHGFMFSIGDSTESVFLWDLDLGWMWTSDVVYPSIYLFSRDSWAFYLLESSDPRFFFIDVTQEWEAVGGP